jgi:hypothetical protein
MACELEQKAYSEKPSDVNYNRLKACERTAHERGEASASRQAEEASRARAAETAALYAAGGPMKDMQVGPDYQHGFDPSKYMVHAKSQVRKGPGIGLILGGVFGGGILLLVMLYFLVKGKGGGRPRYPGYPPGYKKKSKKKSKKKKSKKRKRNK